MKRILVVDDSVVLRGSVCALLAQEFPGAIVGEAAAALPAFALVAEEHWDLVLLDLSLPDRGGVETLRELRTLRPNLPVVVMSLHAEAEYGAAMRAAGAVGYISKGSSAKSIAAAIRTILGQS
jgi:two-component system invasion response regulator UvrY